MMSSLNQNRSMAAVVFAITIAKFGYISYSHSVNKYCHHTL